ncbi:MAG TPA: hypothetical protein VMD30_07865 [Tepidisphaeraceae bacterium]|nr:hypothetical protein [Tepidisphaeraceae bacterium]
MENCWARRTIVAVIALGTVCRVAQYFSDPSFWGDEAYLILNVRAKSAGELAGPMKIVIDGLAIPPQMAPPLYLLWLKACVHVFGDNEYAWRLPALLCGIVALPLAALIAWRVLLPWGAALATTWIALCVKLIEHSVLVKQYSGDVACTLLLLLVAVSRGSAMRRLGIVALLTAPLLWLATPSVLVFAGIAVALLPEIRRESKRPWLGWLICCIAVAISFLLLKRVSLDRQDDQRLHSFWAASMLDWRHPLIWSWWLFRQTFSLCNYAYEPWGIMILLLAAAGMRRVRFAKVLMAPIVVTLLAAMFDRYPFGGARVDLFLVPTILILAAAGIQRMAVILNKPNRCLAFVLAAIPTISGLGQSSYHLVHPYLTSQLRPVLEWVRPRVRPDDTLVLVGPNTWPVCYVYWPQPPSRPMIVGVNEPCHPRGRFWCICEYAPGEFAKKRQTVINRISAGLAPLESYVGEGGAAFLFDREEALR